jgi:hypothetical protein
MERLERFRPNLVHILLYVCKSQSHFSKNLMYILYIFHREDGVGAGNLDDSHC